MSKLEDMLDELTSCAQRLRSALDGRTPMYAMSAELEKSKQAILEYVREQTRWIPVSERLPEDNGRYVIWCSTHFKGYWIECLFEFGQFLTDAKVTHWREGPPAPETKQMEDEWW